LNFFKNAFIEAYSLEIERSIGLDKADSTESVDPNKESNAPEG